MERFKIGIIGGGAVGSAIAYELSKTIDDVVLMEKNKTARSDNQSGRNSGVIHAGMYYKQKVMPNKAGLCPRGNFLVDEFCQKYDVPHKITGKLIVTNNDREGDYVDDVFDTAKENGVPKVRWITGKEAHAMEPNVKCDSALYVPTSGIVKPIELVEKYSELAEKNGAQLLYGTEVTKIEHLNDGGFRVYSKTHGQKEEYIDYDYIINAAGVYADDVAKMINPESPIEIEGVRGESACFNTKDKSKLKVNGNVYPAPYGYFNFDCEEGKKGDKADVPFDQYLKLLEQKKITKTVGVHLTPTLGQVDPITRETNYFDSKGKALLNHEVTIGPAKNVGYGKEDFDTNKRPMKYYHDGVKSFFPNLPLGKVVEYQQGIMAVPKHSRDWTIERDPKYSQCIHVAGIDSPGLTSSLAIAERVRDIYLGKK